MNPQIFYKIINNHITIPGTDELSDSKIFLQCWPIHGVHAGVYKWVMANIKEIKKKLDINKTVYIDCHSLGVVGVELGRQLVRKNYSVEVEICGGFPIYTRQVVKPYNLKLIIREYGNDPITRIFPWFCHLDKRQHEGPKRVWWKVILQIFKIRRGDHMGYYK